MADLDDDYDDGYYYDDDYVYVDDSFDLADELAENAIPEPPLVDRKEEDWDDFDSYDYWMDIEYNTDEYYDTLLQKPDQNSHQPAGKKRKALDVNVVMAAKRRKVSAVQSKQVGMDDGIHEIAPVIWLSFEETHSLCDVLQPHKSKTLAPYALFSDWRERFKDSAGFFTAPQAMRHHTVRKASKIGDETTDQEIKADEDDGNNDITDDEEEQEEDDEKDEESFEEDEQEESSDAEEGLGLDPQQLMAVLQQRLSGASMDAAQQAKFMDTIMSTLAGGGGEGLDDVLEELTDSILNQATEGGSDSGAAKWLSQQGVSLGDEEDQQNDETQQAREEDISALETGPTSSMVDLQDAVSHGDITQADQAVLDDVEAAEKPVTTSAKEPKTHDVPTKAAAKVAAKSAHKGKAVAVAPAKATRSKAGKEESLSKSSTTNSKGGEQAAARKRKVEVDETTQSETKPKRQARNFAAPTAASSNKNVETTKRTTRSTRQNKK